MSTDIDYLTLDEFEVLCFPSGAFSQVPSSSIQMYIDIAQSFVQSELQFHYKEPLLLTGSKDIGIVKFCIATIASYHLMQNRGLKSSIAGTGDEILQSRYAEVMDPENGILRRLATGKMRLKKEVDSTPNHHERSSKMIGKLGTSFSFYDSDGKDVVF